MAIHSSILVHWTGNSGEDDIEKKFRDDEKTRAEKYVERLKDDYEKGLYAQKKLEASIRYWNVRSVKICFTEIRLSQTHVHAERYGKLGIGFSRQFILDRGGRPVIYVPFEPKKDGKLLESSIDDLRQYSEMHKEIKNAVDSIMAHVVRMSPDGKGNGDELYEEMEWRLVHDGSLANTHFAQDTGNDVYRLRFEPRDIKVIIFPNETTQQMALQDKTLSDFFAKHMPIMATLEDCSNF